MPFKDRLLHMNQVFSASFQNLGHAFSMHIICQDNIHLFSLFEIEVSNCQKRNEQSKPR